MGRAPAKTIVESVKHDGVPHYSAVGNEGERDRRPRYSAAGNGKEIEIKESDGSSLLSSKEPVERELTR
jgi:hypothetical protein